MADRRDSWRPQKPPFRPLRIIAAWIASAAAVYVAGWLSPGVDIDSTASAFMAAAFIAIFNAIVPPVVAALRLPFTLLVGFLLVLVVDAVALMVAADALPDHISVNSFGDALVAALVIAAVSIVLQVVMGTNDDDTYTLRVVRRIVRHQRGEARTDAAGIVFLEIDGLARPVLARAMRDVRRDPAARYMLW